MLGDVACGTLIKSSRRGVYSIKNFLRGAGLGKRGVHAGANSQPLYRHCSCCSPLLTLGWFRARALGPTPRGSRRGLWESFLHPSHHPLHLQLFPMREIPRIIAALEPSSPSMPTGILRVEQPSR